MRFRLGPLVACTLLVPFAICQEDEGKSKSDQRHEFHSIPVTGMDATTRLKGFAQREQMEKASPFGGLNWRNVGPEIQGGRVVEIAGVPSRPDRLYVAFATGGLYRTDDDGVSWTSVFEKQSAFGIGTFALSKDGKTIWVGSGEANSQRTAYAGTGVFKSTDEGATWKWMGLPDSHHIGSIVIDPVHPDTVYVAASGHLYSENPERGVYKTTDGGKTWAQVLKVDSTTGAFDIVMDPGNPNVLIASMWDKSRRAWDFVESGTGTSVYRTENAGKSWSKVPSLPNGENAGRIDLDWSPSNRNVVYAVVDNQGSDDEWFWEDERVPSGRLTPRRFLRLSDETLPQIDVKVLGEFIGSMGIAKSDDVAKDVVAKKINFEQLKDKIEKSRPNAFKPPKVVQDIYRSDDGGRNFHRAGKGDTADYQYYFAGIHIDPKDPNTVISLGFPMLKSIDGGKTWERSAPEAHVDFHAVWFDPRDSKKLWIGNDGGLYFSGDGGDHTRHIENLAVGQATTLALDNKRPYNIYIGLQDNGTMKGPNTYVQGRTNPDTWKSIGGGDGSSVAVDQRNDGDIVYTSSQFGAQSGLNQLTDDRWSARPVAPKGDPASRFNWVAPISISPHLGDIVYFGTQRLYRSMNLGVKYAPISPDLTKNKPNGNVPFSTIKSISESPVTFGLIYTGADDGRVMMTRDGGFAWSDIPTPTPDKWVSRIVASKYDEGTVYVAQSGYREDDFAPYLWKSTDFGKTWKSIAAGLPNGEPINVIVEDPTKKDYLYVGTDMGVFASMDGGNTWIALSGMPNVPVHDLAVQAREGDLVAATHGRSVFILPLKPVYDYADLKDKDLKIISIPSLATGSGFRPAPWGYEQPSRWAKPSTVDPKATVNFFSKSGGKGFLRIKKDGKLIKEIPLDARIGYNTVLISVLLTPGKPILAKPLGPVKTGAEAVADPYLDSRAKYLEKGDYDVEIEIGSNKESGTLTLSAPKRGAGDEFDPNADPDREGG